MLKIFFFLLVIGSLNVYSQNERIFLHGKISDKLGGLANVHVINLNTKHGTYTNDNGNFKIPVKLNDSLRFSFVGYETKLLKVTEKYFGIKNNNFLLNKTTYTLDEVNLKRNNLLGFLSADSKLIKKEKVINAETLKLPFAGSRILTPAERRLQTAQGGSNPYMLGLLGGSVSLDLIINSISGRIKKLKKIKAIEESEKNISFIKNIHERYIINELSISKDNLYRFIYFCEADSKFIRILNQGEIAMINFLKQKSKEFKNL
ncbi:carboxypeptidase-like regulatory domain-containing protein [Tenacibaculum halocynthiae]|uniref:carboxypeptidase-like regulatory domain-containing protein n=1 Tax=Tenacibaculum halocynthiae TaxID=1254437 RepID=UPI003D658FD7